MLPPVSYSTAFFTSILEYNQWNILISTPILLVLWKEMALLEMQELNVIFKHTLTDYCNLYSIDEVTMFEMASFMA